MSFYIKFPPKAAFFIGFNKLISSSRMAIYGKLSDVKIWHVSVFSFGINKGKWLAPHQSLINCHSRSILVKSCTGQKQQRVVLTEVVLLQNYPKAAI